MSAFYFGLLFLALMVWFVVVVDGLLISHRVEKNEPYVRPTPEEEDELVHGLWATRDVVPNKGEIE